MGEIGHAEHLPGADGCEIGAYIGNHGTDVEYGQYEGGREQAALEKPVVGLCIKAAGLQQEYEQIDGGLNDVESQHIE